MTQSLQRPISWLIFVHCKKKECQKYTKYTNQDNSTNMDKATASAHLTITSTWQVHKLDASTTFHTELRSI